MDIAPPGEVQRPVSRFPELVPPCPAALRESLEADGWKLGSRYEALPDEVTYGFVARGRDTGGRRRSILVFGYQHSFRVRLSDVWQLVAAVNAHGLDRGILCLGTRADISPQAQRTAADLGIEVLRLCDPGSSPGRT